ncbi:MAG: putative methylase [Myxococcales bacterium]|nr:putative methylase [Myxococcales bacterium]
MLRHYRAMADDPRLDAFQRAIAAAVRPGDVVADVGCGLGIFSIFACRAGAARVLAVEEGPIVEVAREVVRANGCADRVQFLVGRSTTLAPPERARVVLFEDYRLELSTPAVVRTVADLQARWLAEDGVMLPGRVRQYLAAVEDPAGRKEIDRFADRGDLVSGVSLLPTRRRAFAEPFPRRLAAGALLGEPIVAREAAVADLQAAFAIDAHLTATRDGQLDGLLSWIDLQLGDTWLSNAPAAPRSAWTPLLFPFETPLTIRNNDVLQATFEVAPFDEALVFRWSAAAAGARVAAHSLDSLPLLRPPSRS